MIQLSTPTRLFDALYEALSEPATVRRQHTHPTHPQTTKMNTAPGKKQTNTQVGFGAECLAVVVWSVLVGLGRALLYALRLEPYVPHALVFANPVLLQVRVVCTCDEMDRLLISGCLCLDQPTDSLTVVPPPTARLLPTRRQRGRRGQQQQPGQW